MIHDVKRVARVGVAVEFMDGSRTMIFSDHPGIELQLDTSYEMPDFDIDDVYRTRVPGMGRTLTIRGINALLMTNMASPQTDVAIESMKRSIEQATS